MSDHKKVSRRPLVIGIAGGSCSGKTTFAQKILGHFPDLSIVLAQDSYYIDQSHRFDGDGGSVNFDHPDSLEFSLLGKHISYLAKGESVEVPLYDFATHSRQKETRRLNSAAIIVVDGTLILGQEVIRPLLDKSYFIECSDDLRFQRRLRRDVEERGRTPEGVKKQFDLQVRPMHDKFVEPSKEFSQVIVTQENFEEQLSKLLAYLKSYLL